MAIAGAARVLGGWAGAAALGIPFALIGSRLGVAAIDRLIGRLA